MTRLPTPALVVDLDVFRRNLDLADELMSGSGKRLRPHVKTHRTPELARMQVRGPTTGISCATVGEAEVMVKYGLTDVLLANEVSTPDKIERIGDLAMRADMTVAVDCAELVEGYGQAVRRRHGTLRVLIDLDVGLGRCGVTSVGDTVALAHSVEQTPGLDCVGLMAYEGRLRAGSPGRQQAMNRARDELARAAEAMTTEGLPAPVVSVGGTSTLLGWIVDDVATEIQAGTYALMESDLNGLGLPFRCAAWVEASVISRRDHHIVLDAGRKTVGCEYGFPSPVGMDAETVAVSEEHVVVECRGDPPPIGTSVRLRPGQVRTTFNLHDQVYLIEGDTIVEKVPVAARGRSQ